MTHDSIRVRGARTHNLRGVDIDIPKRRLTVFAGLSGSGKSSLAFATIAAESRRLINETYSAFLQGFMPALARPDVDELLGLTAAIVVDQQRIGANARSTVGTATDAYDLLRLIFSRLSVPHVGPSAHFSFNLPAGMCPVCEGIGKVSAIDEAVLLDTDLSLNDGAILAPNFGPGTWYWRAYADSGRLDPTKPLREYSQAEWDWLMHAEQTKIRIGDINVTYEGLLGKVRRTFLERESKQRHIQEFVARLATYTSCPECDGSRLNAAARSATVHEVTIADAAAMQLTDLRRWLAEVKEGEVAPVVAQLDAMLDALAQVGLGYISLNRETGTLSGGEAQRVKIVRHLGSALTDVSYVFDEPTAGLHPHDTHRMISLLHQLRDKGNTVLVVEHTPSVIDAADHVIELGPGAGSDGGTITFAGSPTHLRDAETVTSRALRERPALRSRLNPASGSIPIRGANAHNLRNVDVDIPTGVLCAITGVAGSGKSTLLAELQGSPGVLFIDQHPIRGSRRSSPATYTGLLDPIRAAFARANGVKPALFSANSAGACPGCQGAGVIYTDLAMMAGVETVCEECEGRRFTSEVLAYTYQGLAINEVLALTVQQAREVFTSGKASEILDRLIDVGLPYLTLGQPLTTLSGGERQRLKLAASMRDGVPVYVLDEPTAGMHLSDTANLIAMLHRLTEAAGTVIVIEHNLAVIAAADWIIDIGPGAGHEGGDVVFEGTPAEMVASADTLTAVHLRDWTGAGRLVR